ncbi:MAG: tRNA uridine-5-carboxymethylaminomethyl(34) synthesis GTPase MnmE [Alphaproteobacteria bacterium]|nr:tRNA uridine-5-carboxymethylaminomethyl(34) synthesis GTPase MnmE [Alphaproteobacteria bacterium]
MRSTPSTARSSSIAHSDALIVASATPWGRSAIAVVRVSGAGLRRALAQVCAPKGGWPPPRRARLCDWFDERGVFDEGLLTIFPGSRSYTGEPLAELSCHGNPVIVERLLAALVGAGARVAEPGEFTRRAFLNGRMDLTRAEAVLQAISAATPAGVELARAGLDGAVAALVDTLRDGLTDAIAELEARLDHPTEDLTFEDDGALVARLGALGSSTNAAAATFQAGRVLVDGATVALVGPVNAGKSSLFNALGGSTRALVSPKPGTTRDVVERRVVLDSVAVTLLDTAGERDGTDDLEAEGIALGRALTADADLLLVIIPAHAPARAAETLARTAGRPRLLVGNHADRPGAQARVDGQPMLMTCARTGEGVDALRAAIAEALVGEQPGGARLVIASQRQRDLLLEVAHAVEAGIEALTGDAGWAVAAEELYGALGRLDHLDGRDTREAVLDRLFSRFCIGK